MSIVLIVTLDIKNAFNSGKWESIVRSLSHRNIPMYLQSVVKSNFEERLLNFETASGTQSHHISAGVPLGSVMGPLLWNIVYDGVLRLTLPADCELTCYADDVALTVVAKHLKVVEAICNAARPFNAFRTGLYLLALS